MNKFTLFLFGTAALLPYLSVQAEGNYAKNVAVMKPGDYNSKYYRIPALEVLPDGTLLLVADKRIESNGDLPGKIDIVCRRSTDGGHTWSDYITIAEHDATGGYGDPSVIRDRNSGDIIVISNHGHGLWDNAPSRACVSRSRDGGLTWEAPVDISDQIYTTNPTGSQPIKLTAGFASSGRSVQLASGRIMYAMVTRRAGVNNFINYAIYSDDGGYTWKASSTPVCDDGDESKIAELADGTLLMSIRARNGDFRRFSISEDQGDTWNFRSAAYSRLYDVKCNGDFLTLQRNGKEYLLHSLPAGPGRKNVSIYASSDRGRKWPISYQVSDKESAYSSMCLMPDGESVGIVWEEQDPDHTECAYRLVFSQIALSDIFGDAGADLPTADNNEKASYFDVSGNKMKAEPDSGLYIRKTASSASKLMK